MRMLWTVRLIVTLAWVTLKKWWDDMREALGTNSGWTGMVFV